MPALGDRDEDRALDVFLVRCCTDPSIEAFGSASGLENPIWAKELDEVKRRNSRSAEASLLMSLVRAFLEASSLSTCDNTISTFEAIRGR